MYSYISGCRKELQKRNFTFMSMLKKLKGIFIEESQGNIDDIPKASKPSKKSIDTSGSASSEKPTATKMDKTSGTPDNKFTEMLFKAIEENNLEGFDYLEFKQSLQSLKKVEVDEVKRFQSAFAMASTMGLTKTKLFESAKHYAAVLSAEEEKFADAFQKQRNAQVKDRETKGQMLSKSIKNKEDQIKRLQAEIAKEKEQLANIELNINKAMAKVEATKERFYGSYSMVLNQIKGDIEKFKQYLA
ncbi:MAG: hypothetical protein ACI9FN_002866 [Saprospiraceae bacterium]|jgi:hypothetical protein